MTTTTTNTKQIKQSTNHQPTAQRDAAAHNKQPAQNLINVAKDFACVIYARIMHGHCEYIDIRCLFMSSTNDLVAGFFFHSFIRFCLTQNHAVKRKKPQIHIDRE